MKTFRFKSLFFECQHFYFFTSSGRISDSDYRQKEAIIEKNKKQKSIRPFIYLLFIIITIIIIINIDGHLRIIQTDSKSNLLVYSL